MVSNPCLRRLKQILEHWLMPPETGSRAKDSERTGLTANGIYHFTKAATAEILSSEGSSHEKDCRK